ncbi:sugar ABC transporter permease [Rhodophyticola sp. CCM32]|uniref:carbohydrate ABC transporter permease n=1 Tax=Rhodophyticola sp. CCM32 TaxID=2916397 RepID=UPI00107F79E0|nr:sugar ABC transporter permease [Rhodophyticola sp. CCM32]QBY01287.1 sugar ABC transporter permease [Rhodophyticola sp. CCM32]
MIAPAILLLLTFLVAPFLLSFWTAMTNQPLIPRPVPVQFVGFRNYERILTDDDFWQAVWNVVRFTLMVIPVQCGLALALAMLLNAALPFRNFFRGVMFLPQITSMVVVCVIWVTIYQYPSGPANQLVHILSFGLLDPVDWLAEPSVAMPALVVLSAWQAYGFQMIIYLAGLQSISEDLYDAAKLDGASPLRRFWHVTMPGLRPTHVLVLLVTTIQAFKLYTQVAILTQGGPRGTTDTIVHYIVEAGFARGRLGAAAAGSVILFVLVLFITLIQRRALRRYDV